VEYSFVPELQNILTFDVEDWYHCLDPDPDNWDRYEDRIVESTHAVLDVLQQTKTRATFFVLGHVAERHPELVRELVDAGQEIATHGTNHRFVYQQEPEQFARDVETSVSLLHQITGQTILGYRAPYFSVTSQSLWALSVLQQAGLRYDSSIFPVINHRYGIPDAPRKIHRTDSGLWELPPSTYRCMNVNIPCCGGVYFRFLPYIAIRAMFRSLNRRGMPVVFYLHPWELDADQPRVAVSRFLRFRHYWRLKHTARKLKRLITDFPFGSAREALGI
jgi:polysaccharide deacetylase family protein (PEP-CTERM system associated)